MNIFHDVTPLLQSYVTCLEDFDIGNKLGEGGFGEVYFAIHEPTGIECAIKKLFFKELKGDDLLLFKRETEVLVRCNNPFCLPMVGWTAFYPFAIITKFVQNGSLYDALHCKRKENRLTGTEKSIIMLGMAIGMEHIHSLGILHRDLKSMNILLDENIYPLICDFGLSRFRPDQEGCLTREIGTPNWMAPELFKEGEYTEKVDIFSFAMILYEMICERTPWGDVKDNQIASKLLKGERPHIRHSKAPSSLLKLIEKCWAQNPAARPSFAEIVKELKKGHTLFHDTDSRQFEKFVKYTNSTILGPNQSTQPQKPPLFSESAILRAASGAGDFHRPRFDRLRLSVLDEKPQIKYSKKEYEANLKLCIGSVSGENASLLFANLRDAFSYPEGAIYRTLILENLEDLFTKKKGAVPAFLESGLLELLPYNGSKHCILGLQVCMAIISKDAASIAPPLLEYAYKCIPFVPELVIRILYLALTKFDGREWAWQLVDFFLDAGPRFFIYQPRQYMGILLTFMTNGNPIGAARDTYIKSLLIQALKGNNTSAASSLQAIIALNDDKLLIPPDLIAECLQKVPFSTYAYLLRYPKVIINDECAALISADVTKKTAFSAALYLADAHGTNALALLKYTHLWVYDDAFSVQKKNRLMLTILQHKRCRNAGRTMASIVDLSEINGRLGTNRARYISRLFRTLVGRRTKIDAHRIDGRYEAVRQTQSAPNSLQHTEYAMPSYMSD